MKKCDRSLHQPVLDLDPVQLLQHGLGGEPEEDPGRGGVDGVHGEAGDVACDELLAVDLVRPHEDGGGVHDPAVDDNGAQGAENAQRHAASSEDALAEQHARQEADDARGEHLPRRPRTGGEHHVRYQHRDRSDEEARLPAEGDAGDDDQRQNRLEARQHEEHHAPGHADGAEHRDDDELPRLRLAPFKDQEEGRHTLQHHHCRLQILHCLLLPFPMPFYNGPPL